MCDISKELQFGVIDFFYLLAFNFPHCYGLSHTNAITYHSIEIVGNRQYAQYVYRISIPTFIPGRKAVKADLNHMVAPQTISICSLYLKHIFTFTQLIIES